MSESNTEPEFGLISDEELPEDLRPDENSVTGDSDEDSGEGATQQGAGGPPGPAQ